MNLFRFKAGTAPLLVSMPHVGTSIPEQLLRRMTPLAARLDDTDWHVDRLYDFLDALDLFGSHRFGMGKVKTQTIRRDQ